MPGQVATANEGGYFFGRSSWTGSAQSAQTVRSPFRSTATIRASLRISPSTTNACLCTSVCPSSTSSASVIAASSVIGAGHEPKAWSYRVVARPSEIVSPPYLLRRAASEWLHSACRGHSLSFRMYGMKAQMQKAAADESERLWKFWWHLPHRARFCSHCNTVATGDL